jgi:hypothetical protein
VTTLVSDVRLNLSLEKPNTIARIDDEFLVFSELAPNFKPRLVSSWHYPSLISTMYCSFT